MDKRQRLALWLKGQDVAVGVDESLQSLVKSKTTIAALQACKPTELHELLANISEEVAAKLRSLWAAGNPPRKECGPVDLRLIHAIEVNSKCTSLADVTEEQWANIKLRLGASHGQSQIQARVLQRASKRAPLLSRASQRKQAKANASKMLDRLERMQNKLISVPDDAAIARVAFDFGLNLDFEVSGPFDDNLKKLIELVARAKDSATPREYPDRDVLLFSAAVALRGVCMSPELCAAGQAITCTHAQLEGPTRDNVSRVFHFGSSTLAAYFCHLLELFGLSMAIDFVEASHGFIREATNQASATNAAVVKLEMYSTASFPLSWSNILLSEELHQMLAQVHSPAKADALLEAFGSHVALGRIQLGGAVVTTCTANCTEPQPIERLVQAAEDHLSAKDGAPQHETITFEVSKRVIGPVDSRREVLQDQLLASNKVWAVVDRGDTSALVPVWDLITTLQPGYAKQAELLHASFHNQVINRCQGILWKEDGSRLSTSPEQLTRQADDALTGLELTFEPCEARTSVQLLLVGNALNTIAANDSVSAAAFVLGHAKLQEFLSCVLGSSLHASAEIAHALLSAAAMKQLASHEIPLKHELEQWLTPTTNQRRKLFLLPTTTTPHLSVDLDTFSRKLGQVAENTSLSDACCRTECLQLIASLDQRAIPDTVAQWLQDFVEDDSSFSRAKTRDLCELLAKEQSPPQNSDSSSADENPPEPELPTHEMRIHVTDLVPNGRGLTEIIKDRNDAAMLDAPEDLLKKIMQRQGKAIFAAQRQNQAPRVWGNPGAVELGPPAASKSIAEIVIDLMHSLSFPARALISRQLLDQRLSVPLLTKASTSGAVLCHAQALRYAPVLYDVDQHANLLFNATLPRVAVICDRPARDQHTGVVMHEVFGLKLFASSAVLRDVWLGELGLGMCGSTVVVVMSLFGDIEPALDLVDTWADIVLVEVGEGARESHAFNAFTSRENFDPSRVWAWAVSSSIFQLYNRPVGTDPTPLGMAELILEVVLTAQNLGRHARRSGRATLEQATKYLNCDQVDMLDIQKRLESMAGNTGPALQLQRSFALEQQYRDNANKAPVNDALGRTVALKRAEDERVRRHHLVNDALSLPAMKVLLQIIATDDCSTRTTAMLEFEECLRQLLFRVDDRTTFQPEHVWRELTHIFATDPTRFGFLAENAARLMLDGFALELVDGESRAIVDSWVDTLITQLSHQIRNRNTQASVVALSTFGEQSSGKSTLLNVAFGTRLRASVGRCTRGVYFQLVRRERYTQNGAPAEYILLLDTEGIRAPEFRNSPNALQHDNFLAMLAVVSADACVLLIKGERAQGMEETIPLVVLGMETSQEVAAARAEGCATQLSAAFTAVDRNQRADCIALASGMLERLRREVTEAVALAHGKSFEDAEQAGLTTTLLGSFTEQNITFVGSYKVDQTPIKDEPVTDYGERVHGMLQSIIAQALNTDNRRLCTLHGWLAKFKIAYRCAKSVRWRVQLHDIKAARTAEELDQLTLGAATVLSFAYSRAFDNLAKNMQQSRHEHNSETDLVEQLKVQIMEFEISQTNRLDNEFRAREITENDFRDRMARWQTLLSQLEQRWSTEAVHSFNCLVSFGQVADDFKCSLQLEIQRKHRAGEFNGISEEDRGNIFADLFKRMLLQADERYSAVSAVVTARVKTIYSNAARLNAQDFAENKSWQQMSSVLNLVGVFQSQFEAFRSLFFMPATPRTTAQKKMALTRDIITVVASHLQSVQRFEESVVTKVFNIVKRHLLDRGVKDESMTYDVHVAVCLFLQQQLFDKQIAWEKTNSVRGRLEAARPELLAFFTNTLAELSTTELFAMSLSQGINSRFGDNAFEFVVNELAQELVSNAPWVGSATIVRAEVDLALLKAAQQGFSAVWPLIADPSQHQVNTLKSLIKQFFSSDRSARFVAEFCRQIKDELEQGKRQNTIQELLTFLRGSKFACTRDSACGLAVEVFDSLSREKICDAIDKVIAELNPNFKRGWEDNVPTATLKVLQSNKFATGTARIACTEACKLCGLTCERRCGHDTDETVSADAKLHHCRHQPGGLKGTHVVDSKLLVWESCSLSAKEDQSFRVGAEGEWTKYRDFSTRFPNWKTPAWDTVDESDENIAREFIFFKFNKQLAAKCGYNPTPSADLEKYNIPEQVVWDKLYLRAGREV